MSRIAGQLGLGRGSRLLLSEEDIAWFGLSPGCHWLADQNCLVSSIQLRRCPDYCETQTVGADNRLRLSTQLMTLAGLSNGSQLICAYHAESDTLRLQKLTQGVETPENTHLFSIREQFCLPSRLQSALGLTVGDTVWFWKEKGGAIQLKKGEPGASLPMNNTPYHFCLKDSLKDDSSSGFQGGGKVRFLIKTGELCLQPANDAPLGIHVVMLPNTGYIPLPVPLRGDPLFRGLPAQRPWVRFAEKDRIVLRPRPEALLAVQTVHAHHKFQMQKPLMEHLRVSTGDQAGLFFWNGALLMKTVSGGSGYEREKLIHVGNRLFHIPHDCGMKVSLHDHIAVFAPENGLVLQNLGKYRTLSTSILLKPPKRSLPDALTKSAIERAGRITAVRLEGNKDEIQIVFPDGTEDSK